MNTLLIFHYTADGEHWEEGFIVKNFSQKDAEHLVNLMEKLEADYDTFELAFEALSRLGIEFEEFKHSSANIIHNYFVITEDWKEGSL